jgi:hypothetical protein
MTTMTTTPTIKILQSNNYKTKTHNYYQQINLNNKLMKREFCLQLIRTTWVGTRSTHLIKTSICHLSRIHRLWALIRRRAWSTNSLLLIYWTKALFRIIELKDSKGIKIRSNRSQAKRWDSTSRNTCSKDWMSFRARMISKSKTDNPLSSRIRTFPPTRSLRVHSCCKMMIKPAVSSPSRPNTCTKIWCQTSRTRSCREPLELVAHPISCRPIPKLVLLAIR